MLERESTNVLLYLIISTPFTGEIKTKQLASVIDINFNQLT